MDDLYTLRLCTDILMEQKIIIMNTEKIKSGILFGGFIKCTVYSDKSDGTSLFSFIFHSMVPFWTNWINRKPVTIPCCHTYIVLY